MPFIFPIDGQLNWAEVATDLGVPPSIEQILIYSTQKWKVSPKNGQTVSLKLRAPFSCQISLYKCGDQRALALWPQLDNVKLGTQPGAPWIDTGRLRPVLIVGINIEGPQSSLVHYNVIGQVIWRQSAGIFSADSQNAQDLWVTASEWHTHSPSTREAWRHPEDRNLGGSQDAPSPPSDPYNGLIADQIAERLDTLNLVAGVEFASLSGLPDPTFVYLGWAWYDRETGHAWWTPFSEICQRMGWTGTVPAPIGRQARMQRGPWSFWGGTPRTDSLRINVTWKREGTEVMRLLNPPMADPPIDLPGAPFSLNGAHTATVEVSAGPSGSHHSIHVSSPVVHEGSIDYPNRTSSSGTLSLPDLPEAAEFWSGLAALAAARGQPRITIQVAGERFRLQAAGRLSVLRQASEALVGASQALQQWLAEDSPAYRRYRRGDGDPVDCTVKRRDLVLMAQKLDTLRTTLERGNNEEKEEAQKLGAAMNDTYKTLKRTYREMAHAVDHASATLQTLLTRDLWDEVAATNSREGYTSFLGALQALRLTDGGKAHVRSLTQGFLRNETPNHRPLMSRAAWAELINTSPAARESLLVGLLDLILDDINAIGEELRSTPTGMDAVKARATELSLGLAHIANQVGFMEAFPKALQDADAKHLRTLLGDVEFPAPSATAGLTEPPGFADVFRCAIVLLNTSVAVADYGLDPSNTDRRDAMVNSLARLGVEAIRVSSLIIGSRASAALTATAAEKIAHRVPIAIGLGVSAYDLIQSADDTMNEDEDDVFAWKLAGTGLSAAGLLTEVLVLAEVGIVAGPVGVAIGFTIGVLGMLATHMAERVKDSEMLKLAKHSFLGVGHNSDEVSEVDADYRHIYRRFGAQLSHLHHYWHNLSASMTTRANKTVISLSNVPHHATVVIQVWTGRADIWRRNLYWFEAGNYGSHGWLTGSGFGGGSSVVVAQSTTSTVYLLPQSNEAPIALDLRRWNGLDAPNGVALYSDMQFDQHANENSNFRHVHGSTGVQVYFANEHLNRAIISVEMMPPHGNPSIWRFLSHVDSRLHIHGFLSQMHLFSSTLVKKD